MHTTARALDFFREALSLITPRGEPDLWCYLQVYAVLCILALEPQSPDDGDARSMRYADVLQRLSDALEISQQQQLPRVTTANIRSMLGEAHLEYGHHSEAIVPLEAARDDFRKLGLVPQFADIQLRLARAYGSHDRRTIRAALTARRLQPISDFPTQFAIASQLLGKAYLYQGDAELAGRAYRDAVQARRNALSEARLPTAQSWIRRLFRANLAEQACLSFARAAERHPDDGRRQSLLALAVESLDEGKMTGFSEYEVAHLAVLSASNPELLRSYDAAIIRINTSTRIDRAFVTGSWVGPPTARLDEVWLANREEAHAAWVEFEAIRARIRASGGFEPVPKQLMFPELVGLLDAQEAVAYMLSDDADDGTHRLLVLLVLADGRIRMQWTAGRATAGLEKFYDVALWLPNQSTFVRVGWDRSIFVSQLRKALDAAFPAAAQLLTGPLAEELRQANVVRLFLVPCGVLGYLPLHACPVDAGGQTALSEEFAVSYLPSVAVLRSLRARSAGKLGRKVVSVANPVPNHHPLRFAVTQQTLITAAARSGEIRVTELAERAATSPAVQAAVRDASHVDFACHGWLDQKLPLESGLELADKPMTLRELLDTQLLQGVQLVTLTSCQSAVAAGSPFEDEPISLATCFLIAGARAVLGTLWLVDDMATALLVGRFYQHHLVQKHSPEIALGLAQQWLRKLTLADLAAELGDPTPPPPLQQVVRPFDHPLYWAPFVLIRE